MIVTLENCVNRFAGENVKTKIMVDSDTITEATSERALIVRDFI